MTAIDPKAAAWFEALAAAHRETLTFQEIRKGVVALSRIYVEQRGRIGGDVFSGAGKRAAFACFYTPLHYLLIRHILSEVATSSPRRIIDLGCGLLAASAAWAHHAAAASETTQILGIDQNPWAARQARASLRALGVRGRVLQKSLERAPRPESKDAVVAAFTVNELGETTRDGLLSTLSKASRSGVSFLIVEPIARRAVPWWSPWSDRIESLGGRADEWRFDQTLPAFVGELDHAAGLHHGKLSGRSLYLPGRSKIERE